MAIAPLKPTTKVALAVFLLAGLALRWWQLDLRPLHHDESIHVMFGTNYFDHPDTEYYQYNPEYHGPMLYHLLRWSYLIFGESIATARGLIAVFGSLMLFLPLLCRRFLSEKALLLSTGALALSPTLIFWSRFIREDQFVLFGMALMLYGILVAPARYKAFIATLGIVFQYASKENSYVTMALFWAYCVFEFVWKRWFEGRRDPIPYTLVAPLPFGAVILLHLGMVKNGAAYEVLTYEPMHVGALIGALLVGVDVFRKWDTDQQAPLVVKTFAFVSRHRGSFIVGGAISAFIFCYLFTGAFRYPGGILDGLYRKGITYWLEKHSIERIKGPFLFHVYTLAWYEFLFMCAVLVHATHFYLTHGRLLRYAALALLSCALFVGFRNIPPTPADWIEPTFALWKKYKLKDWFDITGFFLLIAHPALVTLGHALKRQWNLAFFGYWFAATFFTYSYLGEKVPWLSAYPLTAGIAYFALYLTHLSRVSEGHANIGQRVAISMSKTLIGIALVFLPVYFLSTRTSGQSLVQDYPQLLSQSGAVVLIGLFVLLMVQVHRRTQLFAKPAMHWVLALLAVAFTGRVAFKVNYVEQYYERGYISQVHTTTKVVHLLMAARHEAEKSDDATIRRIMLTPEAAWPLSIYLRNLPQRPQPLYSYSDSENASNRAEFYYIFQGENSSTLEGYVHKKVPLRGWWVPDFREMTLFRFLAMALNQTIWGQNGFQNIGYLERKSS